MLASRRTKNCPFPPSPKKERCRSAVRNGLPASAPLRAARAYPYSLCFSRLIAGRLPGDAVRRQYTSAEEKYAAAGRAALMRMLVCSGNFIRLAGRAGTGLANDQVVLHAAHPIHPARYVLGLYLCYLTIDGAGE